MRIVNSACSLTGFRDGWVGGGWWQGGALHNTVVRDFEGTCQPRLIPIEAVCASHVEVVPVETVVRVEDFHTYIVLLAVERIGQPDLTGGVVTSGAIWLSCRQ